MLLWYQLPIVYGDVSIFKTQLKYFLLGLMLVLQVFPTVYIIIGIFISAVNHFEVFAKYQWIVALILPLIREVQIRTVSRVLYHSAQCSDSSVW